MWANAAMNDDTTERLARLQAEVSQLREMAMMQTAILQVIAIKQGIAPAEFQALSPSPIPTPFDIMDRLKR
jgi:hypothetical protein